MSAADMTRAVASAARRNPIPLLITATIVSMIAAAVNLGRAHRAIAERDEARAVAVEMWPDWVKNQEPKPWAYILPCPRGDIDVQGMEWMPTTVLP